MATAEGKLVIWGVIERIAWKVAGSPVFIVCRICDYVFRSLSPDRRICDDCKKGAKE